MTTAMIGIFRAKDGRFDELLALVKENARLLRSKGYLSKRPEAILRTADAVILSFEYESGGAERAHVDAEVLALWSRFADLSDSLGLRALNEGEASLPGALSVS